jgi:hypothetical protein
VSVVNITAQGYHEHVLLQTHPLEGYMARPNNCKPTVDSNDARNPPATHSAIQSGNGVAQVREWMSQSLAAAHQAAAQLEHMQRLNAQAATAWVQLLTQATREAEQAGDWQDLMALPAQMWNRQLDLWMRRLSEGSQHLLEAELQWADRARSQTLALGLPWWAGQQPDAVLEQTTTPLASFSQMQDAWLGLSQRWIDSMAGQARQR